MDSLQLLMHSRVFYTAYLPNDTSVMGLVPILGIYSDLPIVILAEDLFLSGIVCLL